MITAMHYEWVRLRSLRSTWWLAAVSVAVTALATWGYAGILLGVHASGAPVGAGEALVLLLSKASAAPVVAGVVGVLAVGGEYRHGTMRTTLLVTPRRGRALAAKAAVVGGFAAVLAVTGMAVAWLVGLVVVADTVSLAASVPALLQVHSAQVLLTAGWGLAGVALACHLRSQLLAMITLLAVPFVIEPMLRTVGLLSGQEWLARVSGYLPFSAGNAMADVTGGAAGSLLAPAAARVDPALGGAVFVAAVGILIVLAASQFRRQDVPATGAAW
jgi:ABC-2 type transport system permease protein